MIRSLTIPIRRDGGRNAPYGEQREIMNWIIDSEEETQVSQKITGLTPGEYAASVMVEVSRAKEREAVVLVDCAGKTSKNYTTKSILLDYDEYGFQDRDLHAAHAHHLYRTGRNE